MQFRTVQGTILESLFIAQINSLQVEQNKIIKLSIEKVDCVLVSNLIKDFYEDLGALFCEFVDKQVMLPHIDSVNTIKPSKQTIIFEKITYWPDMNIRATAFFK